MVHITNFWLFALLETKHAEGAVIATVAHHSIRCDCERRAIRNVKNNATTFTPL